MTNDSFPLLGDVYPSGIPSPTSDDFTQPHSLILKPSIPAEEIEAYDDECLP